MGSSEKKFHGDHCASGLESCQAKSEQEVYSKKNVSKKEGTENAKNQIGLWMWRRHVLFQTRKNQRQSEIPGKSNTHKKCTSYSQFTGENETTWF